MPTNPRILSSTTVMMQSSEMKKGSLVFIQTPSSPPSTSSRWANPHTPTACSEYDNVPSLPRRLPVVVKVYHRNSKHFAVVSFVGRHQMSTPPLHISLTKFTVHHAPESNTIVLRSIGMEESTLTFEASSNAKACEWVKAFERQGGRSVFGESIFKNPLTNLLEQISEEICTAETATTCYSNRSSVDKISHFVEESLGAENRRDSRSKIGDTFSVSGIPQHSFTKNYDVPSSRSRSTLSPKFSGVASGALLLPVLSEQDDETSLEMDDGCMKCSRVD